MNVDKMPQAGTGSTNAGAKAGSAADKSAFDSAIQALQLEIANAGAHLTIDSTARQAYSTQVQAMASELRGLATSGRITWAQAAQQAQETRNAIMAVIRNRSTPVGRAIAERLKRQGKTLNELIARKTLQLFGAGADFNRLPPESKNAVFAEIVKSAGQSNETVTATMRKLSRAGKGLLLVSLAISVYSVAKAEDKGAAARREVAVTGAGIGGGIAGGALAGLACGPGAPVCVTVGAFVGGALAAFGVDYFW